MNKHAIKSVQEIESKVSPAWFPLSTIPPHLGRNHAFLHLKVQYRDSRPKAASMLCISIWSLFCLFIFLYSLGLDRKFKHCNKETKAIFTVYLAWPRIRGNTNIVKKPEQEGVLHMAAELNPRNHLNSSGFFKTQSHQTHIVQNRSPRFYKKNMKLTLKLLYFEIIEYNSFLPLASVFWAPWAL